MAFAATLVMVPVLVAVLSGCSTGQIDAIPQSLGGLPEGAPKRSDNPPAYPAVHDVPPPRAKALMDTDQQKRLEADLVATRTRLQNQQKKLTKGAKEAGKGTNRDTGKPAPAEGAAAKADRPTVKRGRRPTALSDDDSALGGRAGAGSARQAPPAGGNAAAWPAPAGADATGFGRNP